MFPPSSLMMMFLFPTAGVLISRATFFFNSCRSWLQRLCLKTQSASRLTLHWVQVAFLVSFALAVSGLCCWWSLVVADWCWWFEAIAISFYGGVIYEPARTMVYFERRLTIAPQQYLWVARVLDSFFMCWQYRFLTGWPKTNCVPFIKRIPKRTLNLAVFVLDVPVLLCLCVCVLACLKFFQQPWDATRKYTNQN